MTHVSIGFGKLDLVFLTDVLLYFACIEYKYSYKPPVHHCLPHQVEMDVADLQIFHCHSVLAVFVVTAFGSFAMFSTAHLSAPFV